MLSFHDPIVQVIVQMSISFLEVKFLEDGSIFHYIQTVVNVATNILGKDQGILN